jgi:integrase
MAMLPTSAVDLDNRNIHIYRTKTQNESIIRMTDRVPRLMRDRFDNGIGRYVFSDSNGGPRKYRSEAFLRACDRAGLNTPQRVEETGSRVPYHTLRHHTRQLKPMRSYVAESIGLAIGDEPIDAMG